MPCAEFEELLQRYDEFSAAERRNADAHLSNCADCQEYFETLSDLDRELTGLYAGLQPGPKFADSVASIASTTPKPITRLRPPSAWPEVLDFLRLGRRCRHRRDARGDRCGAAENPAQVYTSLTANLLASGIGIP